MVPAFGDNKTIISEDNSEVRSKKRLASNLEINNSSDVNVTNNHTKRGMILPFRPLSLAFNHVNYYVDMPAVSTLFLECNVKCHHYMISDKILDTDP